MERRVEQLIAEGVEVRCGVEVGSDVTVQELRERFDAVVLATGSRVPRDLRSPDASSTGFTSRWSTSISETAGWPASSAPSRPPRSRALERVISAAGKDVVVIGGGDTGADCVGNSLREGARSVVQLELLSEPPAHRPDDRTPWPQWPLKYRLSYAMEEAREPGRWASRTTRSTTTSFADDGSGRVAALHIAQAQPQPPFAPIPGTERELPAQLVLLAMGFLHPEQQLLDQIGVEKDPRGNVKAVKPYTTSVEGVFAAGDARRGQSLIVWAINEGRQCARMVDRYLARQAQRRAASPSTRDCAGHADADEGPEGPPRHVGPGIGAG